MIEKKKIISSAELFVLDMDGTTYLSDTVIPGALEFFNEARAAGRKLLFFTNNTSRNPEDYIQKLSGMGFDVTRKDIVTAGDVTISFLHEFHPGQSVYLVGNAALRRSLITGGIKLFEPEEGKRPEVVLVGFDTELTYEKLERACIYIRKGACFITTHPDINCPTSHGFVPDAGAICAAITASTGVRPGYLGKPQHETVEMICRLTGVSADKILFVGDRLYTDIAVGVNNGAMGALVLTGEATEADIEKSDVKPDAVFASLDEMRKYLI